MSTFESNIDQEGNLTVKQFFQSILDSINSSTGGVNDFKIIENPQQGTLEIISLFNNPYKENFEELNKKKLKNFGNKTLFKSISLTSELTDDISSQIAISAQVDNTDTNGERGDIFAYFNNGIKDRIIPKKTTESSATEETTPTKEETRINNAKSFLDYLLAIYPNNFKKKFPEPSLSVSTAQRYLKELLNYFEQQNPDTRGTSVIIPVNLSFTMQGFSGFKLFNEFIIPTDFLPNLYKSSNGVDPKFKFLVKGINHDISINQWDTSIETFMAPIPEKSGYGEGGPQSSLTTNSDSVGTNPTSTAGEAQTPPPPTTPEEIAPPPEEIEAFPEIVLTPDKETVGNTGLTQDEINRKLLTNVKKKINGHTPYDFAYVIHNATAYNPGFSVVFWGALYGEFARNNLSNRETIEYYVNELKTKFYREWQYPFYIGDFKGLGLSIPSNTPTYESWINLLKKYFPELI